jgi:hypothetical protein
MRLSRGAYRAVHAAPRAEPPRGVASLPAPTGLQVESWRLLWEEYAADPDAQAALAAWQRARDHALPEARALVERFVAGAVDLAAFRAELDRRAKADWRALALRGPAGAMVLNQLVKHAADAAALAAALRRALPAPPDAAHALGRLRAWVREATALVPNAPRAAAPGALVAFAAACWHVLSPERWPAYQPSAREALAREEGLFAPTGDAPADYLAFRHAFLALAASVGVTAAQLERACRAHAAEPKNDDDDALDALDALDAPPRPRRSARVTRPARPARPARVAERAPAYEVSPAAAVAEPAAPGHTQVQWLLARLGRAAGCRVWVAANDHARAWAGEALGTLSLPRLPRLGLDEESERLVRLIDVVWLSGRHRVAAAFEVERTTSVHSGILRMADLAALAPNLSFPMYVVAPRARLPKVRRELARPSLQALGLHRRCGFFAAEALVESADAIARWGGGPDAIARLAEHVGAAAGEGDR